jgi:hypothetical protein
LEIVVPGGSHREPLLVLGMSADVLMVLVAFREKPIQSNSVTRIMKKWQRLAAMAGEMAESPEYPDVCHLDSNYVEQIQWRNMDSFGPLCAHGAFARTCVRSSPHDWGGSYCIHYGCFESGLRAVRNLQLRIWI